MSEYEKIEQSMAYGAFLKEQREYAQMLGYDVTTARGVREAQLDHFLFQEFLDEMSSYSI